MSKASLKKLRIDQRGGINYERGIEGEQSLSKAGTR